MRELLSKRPQPYYIYAPDYRRSSAGIRVMHMLCDALIRSGHEAYVTASVLSPEFMTPQLTEAVLEAHRAQALEPIVVYPEVVDGNPLNGKVVVRYILNRPGFIEGNGQFAEGDILYAYSRDLLGEDIPEDRVLFLPPFDLNLFRLPDNPAKRVPGKTCYYQGRRGELRVDPALLPPDAIEITPTWPESWEELADLFQCCEMFYCCGSSALATEAGLCGCLTVVLVEEGAPRIGVQETQSPGAAWGTSIEELERARRTLSLTRDIWLGFQRDFWPALDHFIEVTQAAAVKQQAASKSEIVSWLQRRSLTPVQDRLVTERRQRVGEGIRLGVVILDLEGDQAAVRKTLDSLAACEKDSAFVRPLLLSIMPVDAYPFDEDQISCTQEDWIVQLNNVLARQPQPWLMLVTAGDQFTQSGLLITDLELMKDPDSNAIFTDVLYSLPQDELAVGLRPDFNLDFLLSFPAGTARHWIFKREALLRLGGFDPSLSEALELDIILRLLAKEGTANFGHISEPLLITKAPLLANIEDERNVIVRHLRSRGYPDAQLSAPLPGRYQVIYGHSDNPVVSVLLLAGNDLSALQRCVEGLLASTSYQNFEILLIESHPDAVEVSQRLQEMDSLGEGKLRLIASPSLSFGALLNEAAAQAIGDYLLFFTSAMEVLHPDWLDALLNHAQRLEVGAVGGMLVTPEGNIAQAMQILGLEGALGSAFIGAKSDASGYMQRLQVDQNVSVLGLPGLILPKDVFFEVGGLDGDILVEDYIAADLTLKLREIGYLLVWAPAVRFLFRSEQKKGASTRDEDDFYARWLPRLARDPAYNPNFSLERIGGFKLADSSFSWRPLQSWSPLPVVLAHPADSQGCGHYRIMLPFQAMVDAGLLEGALATEFMSVPTLERYAPDTVVLQRQVSKEQLNIIRRMKAFSRAFKVYELDDYLPSLPLKNVHRQHIPKDFLKGLRQGLGYVDRFVVSTDHLAEALAGLHEHIHVVNNLLPVGWWGKLSSRRQVSARPRVGWAGGVSHTGDLELIADVVQELASEVDWIFFGMCPDKLRPFVREFHSGVPIDQYPEKLASLDLDLAIAPLENNLFNRCKSNLRLLEYGACGFPVVCSDLEPYQGDFAVTRVRNRFKDWCDAIRAHLVDLDATARQGDLLRQQVLGQWMLQGENLQKWRNAWLPD